MARSVKALSLGSSLPAVAVFVAAALAGTAQAATLAIGPIEQINLKNSTIVVLGQAYQVGPAAALRSQANAPISLSSLATNTLVEINGRETGNGQSVVSSVMSLPQMDVPGATQLLVTGVVSSETSTGEVKIGNLVVDVTATLTSDSQKFTVGGLVQVTGTQPNPNGLFLAQNIISINASKTMGVEGGGASASAMGVEGGGASHTLLGVEGGGASVKAMGVEGGGASASAMGVEGGGASHTLLGVEGGGASVKAMGVEGGGASAMGVEGGGASASAMGVEGGGASASAMGVEGGGASASAMGVEGGGASVKAMGVEGGGASAMGVEGGGASVKAMGVEGGGTSVSTLGVEGGGASHTLLGVEGGGASVKAMGVEGGGRK